VKRKEFSKRTKVQAYERAGGRCEGEGCGKKLTTGDIEYHHIIPAAWAFDGGNDLANCRVYCRSCHRVSPSTVDIPAISKSRRVYQAHIGAKGRSSRPLPFGRSDRYKKKLTGEVVRRKKTICE